MLNEFPMGDLVFVTVGTDHHPFDRLCAWSDAWVADGRHPEVPWFVQSGTSKAPEHAPARDYIRYDEMCDSMLRAVWNRGLPPGMSSDEWSTNWT